MSPNFHRAEPTEALRPYVEAYHQAESPPGHRIDQRVVPRGRSAMVFTLHGHYQGTLGDAPLSEIPPAIAHGQFTRYATNRFDDGHLGFLVMLNPIGWHGLTGHAADQLTNSFIDLEQELPRAARPLGGLLSALRKADGFDARCRVADDVLSSVLAQRGPEPPACRLAGRAAANIEAERGRITVRELAFAMATTERTLRRAFDRVVGVSPKTYAAIVRVNRVIGQLHHSPPENWQDIVDHFGYADQSHFGREFRRYTGVSPTTYLPDEHPLERSFFESG